MEWVMAEQACHAFGFADVPLYDTLGVESLAFITGQTMMATIFTDYVGAKKLIDAKKTDAELMKSLRFVVQFEDVDAPTRAAATAVGLTLRSWAEMLEAGRAHPVPHAPPKPDDLGFICYTSGTTGMPKGAMILHRNMVADASAAFTGDLGCSENDVHLSYLPLAHVFERLITAAMWMCGAAVGFYQGDTLKIVEDLTAIRPTIFPSVPRLYNRIYDRITGKANAAGGIKTSLFNQALEGKKHWLKESNTITHSLWDRLVFRKVAASVGLDRCRIMLTGSAPIAPHVMEFLRVVFSARVCEGYGQTECSAAATLTNFNDQATKGHVGGPLASNRVKLVSVGEMGYNVTDTVHDRQVDEKGAVINAGIPCTGRGEVCYKGFNVFPGYYKDAEKTAEALDADGWLHSGDIGLWDANGNLRIIDRKKNIFKLSQGEYVAAEKIENVYTKSTLIQQAFVYGDSLHAVLVAIIVPDADGLKAWAGKNDLAGKSVPELVASDAVKAAIKADMSVMAKEAKLQGFEQVKEFVLDPTPWTPDDLLTPSFKLKRADAKKKYQKQIDVMYEKVDPIAGKTGLKQGSTKN
jgi:long-chain acyl-CoA synthetase